MNLRFLRCQNYVLSVCFLCTAMLTSCSENKEEISRQDAEDLYRQSKTLLISYTKQLATAKDSTNLDSLAREFEDKLVKLNMSMPAGTDGLLTEEMNDTLAILTARYVAIRNKRLGAPKPEIYDTPPIAPPAAFTKSSSYFAKKNRNASAETEEVSHNSEANESSTPSATSSETSGNAEP